MLSEISTFKKITVIGISYEANPLIPLEKLFLLQMGDM